MRFRQTGYMFDPLAATRTAGDPACDVYLTGTVFLDIIFTGLESAPVRGTESWARGMGSSPGGVANMATALARLGLRTTLAAAFGDDVYGTYCWDALHEGEGVDLTYSRTVPGWHSPVTVSMAYEGERTMVSHGHDAPLTESAVLDPPLSRAAVASLHPSVEQEWVGRAAGRGSKIFADVGWDESGDWDLSSLSELGHCAAFLPNAGEAMRYTGRDTPQEAARALAEHVPLAVVTMGSEGVCAADGGSGKFVQVPAVTVEAALDPTGAGDVFTAGFVMAALADWPLEDQLAFGSLTAALSVQEFGGSLSAPGWAEIAEWCRQVHTCRLGVQTEEERCRYGFLWDLLAGTDRPWPLRRAVPTVGFRPA